MRSSEFNNAITIRNYGSHRCLRLRISCPSTWRDSFTNTLIEVLDDWINKRTFSASCLHAEILFQLKLKETKKGREGKKLEWCTTPIHINYTADSKLPGIELCRRNVLPAPPLEPPQVPEHGRPTTFTDAMDIDFDDSNTAPSPLLNLTDSGEFQSSHVLIKIGLEQNQDPLDIKQCVRWLENVPFLGKFAKIEGVYLSYSTLVILSMPISVWDMLPDHPACTFIGYVTGPNMSPGPSALEREVTNSLDSLPNRSVGQWREMHGIGQLPPDLDLSHYKSSRDSADSGSSAPGWLQGVLKGVVTSLVS
jgi:hypothetical protein